MKLPKFLRLSRADQRLFIKSLFWVGIVRLSLWLLPFQTLRRLLARAAQPSSTSGPGVQLPLERLTWAIKAASHFVPASTCLTQALAAQMLLTQQGYPAHLCIGVDKSETGRLEAHAWVESEGQIVIGDLADLVRFTPLPLLEQKKL